MPDWGWTLVAMGVGVVGTWLCTWLYYVRAAKKLEKEASELKRLNKLILLYMETPGPGVKLTRDEHGEITGLTLSLSGKVEGTSTVSGQLSQLGG